MPSDETISDENATTVDENATDVDPMQDLLETLDLEELGSAKVSVQQVRIDEPEEGAEDREPIMMPEAFAEDITLFRGRSQKMPHNRVFGGQVLAQSVIAAGRTVAATAGAERRLHSLHAYFMRPGDDTQPITFGVERMRDGRSFSTRRVHALQHGKPILSMSASFQDPAGGMDHQDEMPQMPEPLTVPSLSDVYGGIDHPQARHVAWQRPIEQRHVEGNLFVVPAHERVARNHTWMRALGTLPDDPLIHDAVLAYGSDYSLLDPVIRRHGRAWGDGTLTVASLDHSMWFHRPARADEWILYAQESPSAQGGRGLAIGRMFSEDGTLVATVAQEGMMRAKDLP